MTVDTMRTIDFIVGVPLCFLASLWFGLIRFFIPTGKQKPENVLLIELSEMGSAILADPAIRKLQRTGLNVHFAIFTRNADSLRLQGSITEEHVFRLKDNSMPALILSTFRFLAWTRRNRIDTVIDLELFSRFTALLTGFSGASTRVGFHAFCNEGLYRGAMLTHRVGYNPHLHIAKNFIALVNATLSQSPEHPYSKTLVSDEEIVLGKASVTEPQKQAMHESIQRAYPAFNPKLHRLVLINPNSSDMLPQRRWPPERFVELMNHILQRHTDVVILLTGSNREQAEADVLRMKVGEARCVAFAGQTRLIDLPALYSVATLMVTNDSGPGHFAAVTDLPTIVLFGPETPSLYGPLGNTHSITAGLCCSPCVSAANHRKTPCRDNVCLQAITVARVLSEAESILSPPSTTQG